MISLSPVYWQNCVKSKSMNMTAQHAIHSPEFETSSYPIFKNRYDLEFWLVYFSYTTVKVRSFTGTTEVPLGRC